MIPEQRRRDILQLLGEQGASSIADLSVRYGVSEMTIRRDLKMLDGEGYVKLTHGGALFIEQAMQGEPTYAAKQTSNISAKTRIGRFAAQEYVTAEGDMIGLEAGTTIGAMVAFLANKQNLTVATNGLRTTNLMQTHAPAATTICTGGILRNVSSTFVGPIAEQFFREFHIRKVFLSSIGFTVGAGLTDPQMIDTQVKKSMIGAADQVIALIDSSKIGVKSFIQVIPTQKLDVLITDNDASADVLHEIEQLGVRVHVV